MAETTGPEVREALEELQQYLSDTLPPLVVADSFQLLLRYSPEIVASSIHAWTVGQYRRGGQVPLSDYLFHAVKKIHAMGEFGLVPKGPFEQYLVSLKELVVAYCPEGDREFLRSNLDRLDEVVGPVSSSVEVLFRQSAAGDSPRETARRSGSIVPSGASPEEFRDLRRFSLLLERLEQQLGGGARLGAAGEQPNALASQALAAAARGSQNEREFEQYLDRLRQLGMDVETKDVFRSLGSSLPGWLPPVPAGGSGTPAPQSEAVEAMHRIVTQADDPAEGARRLHEMVKTAVERFNEGSLAQAVTMLELAERIIAERKVDSAMADLVRRKADEGLDNERLRKYAEAPEQHAFLRKALNFFTNLTPNGLLNDLRRELKRERRRLLLLLLEVHGAPSREAALERLRPPFGQGEADEEWYFRRNLLYLLRRIPRPANVPLDEDVDLAVRHTDLRFPPPLVKEAIANLGQLKHEKAERTLISLLTDLESMLLSLGDAPYERQEMVQLLDRVISALARYGAPNARRAVVEHGLKRKTELGDTMARLTELAGQDLSKEDDSVERLLEALKVNAPFKLFGLVLHQNDQNLGYCIEALSTTPAPAVREVFEDIVRRFPGQDISKAAAKALSGFAEVASPGEAPAPSLSGDLELFGLPALLQSLAESQVSGSLTLRDAKGQVFGTISLRGGKLSSCQTGQLLGEEAFYQLLERPVPGNFLFTRQPDGVSRETGSGAFREVFSLSLEGMRRYDEFQQAAALVPDDMKLKPTGVKPTPHPDERDGILVKEVWTKVSQGATPLDCEVVIRSDSYRIRRLLAHWLESGALEAA